MPVGNPLSLQHKVPPGFHGKKGLSGRKKSPTNITRYLYEQIDHNWAQLVDALVQRAIDGDREMLQYCFDRRLGKPKALADINLEGAEMLDAGTIVEIFRVVDQRQKEIVGRMPPLLEAPKHEPGI